MQLLPRFELHRPESLAAVLALLAAKPNARVVAGGTDLITNLRHGLAAPSALIELARVPELSGIRPEPEGFRLGAGITLEGLADNAELRLAYPALTAAALSVAAPAHRAAATLGGNLCLDTRCVFYNQSQTWRHGNDYCLKYGGDVCHVAPTGQHCHAAFSGDIAPALLVYGAEIEIASPSGLRRIPLPDLYVDDGAAHLALDRTDVLTAVYLKAMDSGLRSGYRKARARAAIDFPLAGVAVALRVDGNALSSLAVALTGTNARPFLLEGTQALLGRPVDDALLTELSKLVQKQVSPMRTTVTASNYRRQVAAVLAARLTRELAASVGQA
jgi:4-hydroxybenzoyl-CoA reductase subunit beta